MRIALKNTGAFPRTILTEIICCYPWSFTIYTVSRAILRNEDSGETTTVMVRHI